MTTIEFKKHYEENYDALKNFALKLTRDVVDAEDLVQDAAAKAFHGKHTFKKGTSFKSWIFTILKNTFITRYHKRRKRALVQTHVEDMSFAIDHKARQVDPVSDLTTKEIKECIQKLSYKSKLPFLMHTEGYQYNEIAETLSIPIGTVKSRINFARKKLKHILNLQGIAA